MVKEISKTSKIFGSWWYLKFLGISFIITVLLILIFGKNDNTIAACYVINNIIFWSMFYNYFWIYRPYKKEKGVEKVVEKVVEKTLDRRENEKKVN